MTVCVEGFPVDLSRESDPSGDAAAAEAMLLAMMAELASSGETVSATYVAPDATDDEVAVLDRARGSHRFARWPSLD